MDNSNLIDYILHGREERNLEYKGNVSWNDSNIKFKLIKTILAMSNIPDGGVIVVGVDEDKSNNKCNPIGLNKDNLASYSQDTIQSAVSEYAEPFVEITVTHVEHDEKCFVVIQIAEFSEMPVICKKGYSGTLNRGEVYTRPKRKNESVKVPSQVEMREIIESAVGKSKSKLVKRVTTAGFEIKNRKTDEELFSDQLGENIDNPILDEITRKGYWKILIRPTIFEKDKIEISKLPRIIEENQVKLKGWYYPFFESPEIRNNYIEISCNFNEYKEFTRFYQSGQFVHFKAMIEDHRNSFPQKSLEFLYALFTLTEIFEFASRLVSQGIITSDISISITLFNVLDRRIYSSELRPLFNIYKSKEERIDFNKEFKIDDFILNHNQFAVDAAIYFFHRFQWLGCSLELLREEQKKLIEKRLSY